MIPIHFKIILENYLAQYFICIQWFFIGYWTKKRGWISILASLLKFILRNLIHKLKLIYYECEK